MNLRWLIMDVRGDFNCLSRMDTFTLLFWIFTLMFISLSAYLLCCTKKSTLFYVQVGSGLGIFATSKIGRKFLGIE